jgi:hypothetical protein
MNLDLENLAIIQFLKRVFAASETPLETAAISIMFIVSLSVTAYFARKVIKKFKFEIPFLGWLYPAVMLLVAFGLTSLTSIVLQFFSGFHIVVFGRLEEPALPFSIQGLMWTIFIFFLLHAAKKYLAIKRDSAKHDGSECGAGSPNKADGAISTDEFYKRVSSLNYMSTSFSYLGMFGTVYGISQGLLLFNNIKDVLTDLNGPLLMEIVAQLGTAFHTTLLGIAMTLISVFILNRMDKQFGTGTFA